VSVDFRQQRPLWLRAFNAAGRGARALGWELVSLDPDELLREAERRAGGLADFGGDEFREPMRRYLESLEREAHLTTTGRILARQDVMCVLVNRLRTAEIFKRHPEILAQPVSRPIFITGLPRSGTSILHELLAQDPAHRVPHFWEVRYAWPPPEQADFDAGYRGNPRIRKANRDLTLWHVLVPAYKTMHEMGGHLPCECGDITTHTFLGDRMLALHQVPSYAAWAAAQDQRIAYQWHRKMLQLLQWRVPRERWVLKGPAHLNWLPALFAVYPDARLIWTHRDPLQVMGSVASLISAILWMRASRVDPELVQAAFGGEFFAAQLDSALKFRDGGGIDPRQFIDVRYQDLMGDTFGTLRRVYQQLDLALDPAIESRMRAYLAGKPKGKFGKHEYSFDDLGLDRDIERARFAAYQARFDIESEVGRR
jgi:hypothetical protein